MPVKLYNLSNSIDESRSSLTGGTDQLGFELNQMTNGQRAGVHLLTLRCGSISLDVIPTRGMGIWQAENKGVRFGWDSPIHGPVHPMWVPVAEPSGLGFLDGFDELMTRCGLNSNGAPEFDAKQRLKWPLHGRIANLPAANFSVEIDPDVGRITAKGVIFESRFHFHSWQLKTEISLQLDSDEIQIVDRVKNLSNRECSFQMLYHNNFGPPVLESGSRLYAPAKLVAPRNSHAAKGIANWDRFESPNSGYAEEVFFLDLAANRSHQTLTMVTNTTGDLGATIRYDTQNLPCFTLWKNTVGLADGYVTGLEPGTNFPNPRSFEEKQGRVVPVASGESTELSLSIGMLVGAAQVEAAIEEINQLAPHEPELASRPRPDWSAPE